MKTDLYSNYLEKKSENVIEGDVEIQFIRLLKQSNVIRCKANSENICTEWCWIILETLNDLLNTQIIVDTFYCNFWNHIFIIDVGEW